VNYITKTEEVKLRAYWDRGLWLFLALLALSVSAYAAPIALTNPGFDADATGTFVTGSLTGWTPNTTEYGVWNTQTSGGGVALAPLSANNVLFLSSVAGPLDGSVSQQTAVASVSGETYTFSIYASSRNDILQPVAFKLELYDGTTLIGSQSYTAGQVSNSQWSQFSVTATAQGAGLLGVRVSLDSSSASIPITGTSSTSKLQVLFDNASLDGNAVGAVPEPMTMSLIGGGLAGLAFLRRRK
jgi:hypothetical protein